jgi:hypothetical protein
MMGAGAVMWLPLPVGRTRIVLGWELFVDRAWSRRLPIANVRIVTVSVTGCRQVF